MYIASKFYSLKTRLNLIYPLTQDKQLLNVRKIENDFACIPLETTL